MPAIAGVVAQDVQPTEARDGEIDQRLHLVGIGDVGALESAPCRRASRPPRSPPSASMSATTTEAPWAAKSSAVARPMPLAAPVTMATLPVSRSVMRPRSGSTPC